MLIYMSATGAYGKRLDFPVHAGEHADGQHESISLERAPEIERPTLIDQVVDTNIETDR